MAVKALSRLFLFGVLAACLGPAPSKKPPENVVQKSDDDHPHQYVKGAGVVHAVHFQVFTVAPHEVTHEYYHEDPCENPMTGGDIFHYV